MNEKLRNILLNLPQRVLYKLKDNPQNQYIIRTVYFDKVDSGDSGIIIENCNTKEKLEVGYLMIENYDHD